MASSKKIFDCVKPVTQTRGVKRLLLTLLLTLAFVSAKADTFTATDFPVFNDGTEYVGPLHVSLNGGPVFLAQCIDISHTIGIPSSYEVNVFNLGGDLTGMRYFTGNNLQSFEEAAFLFTLGRDSAQDTLTQSLIQRAIWGLFPHASGQDAYLNDPGALAFLAIAAAGIQSAEFQAHLSDYNFYSPTGEGGQLFISQVPEPSTYAMAAVGLIALVGFKLRRAR